ncbi:hypothetical protein ACQIBV_003826 [Yersinia enterocolitica]|uniref:hypothetical protein n=1 Tax=Yersinia enterocolitica TaxID=630 RepID=UPI0005E8B8FC|nr:hypothetical protein [Yersinia enterocolitica]EKN3501796.1 hypothetical protein [Yersinia enterocolitica]EKN4062444.1 hypothetical protein [Yersinia enterocolitica]CQH25220.1 Uncharacterised protein [Yersinia enterocolitica]HDL7195497.1 hypothetical protein [Yersinia enterocolitica]HDL7388969.1 hypothetical protein [Yersinia enterocolitica]
MKKITEKQRTIDINRSLNFRRKGFIRKYKARSFSGQSWEYKDRWIKEQATHGLDVEVIKKNRISIRLPEIMNFSSEYDKTMQSITAIRKLAEKRGVPDPSYKLGFVDFSNLKKISTSAALVLTAELSKWDDAIRQRLTPKINTWDESILRKFYDLGFFELFEKSKGLQLIEKSIIEKGVKFVKYLKGKCGDIEKTLELKNEIRSVVGEDVKKWVFLQSGMSEAITNVSQHAYPVHEGYLDADKNWYLTGSYDEVNKILKIVFYDQGIGIPKSLPASQIWERILSMLSKFSSMERKRDEVLLKAAVELDRTSTGDIDRGKGLQDLLEFIKQRGDGYLSIMSLKGLYKHEIVKGNTIIKTENFSLPMCGTLIIWSASL